VNADVLERVRAIGSRSLHWMYDHARDLDTPPTDTVVDVDDPGGAYKPLGETALAASLVLREKVAGPDDLAAARCLVDFAWGRLREGDFLYERQLGHNLLTDPLETYAHFVRASVRHAPMDALLAHLVGLRSTHAVEMTPDRRLAVADARRVVGLPGSPDWAALTAHTWVGARPEPWAIDWMTGYHLTHTVFHVTDWGARPELLPDEIVEYLRMWLPVWVDVWQEVSQFDLVGELLIADACLAEPACDAQGWERLEEAQREDGLLPRDADPVDEDERRAFRDHEHTAVVAIVASTTTLARSLDASPTSPASPAASPMSPMSA